MALTIANFSNMTNPIQLLQAANTHSGGSFWAWMVFLFTVVLFSSMMIFGADVALIVALFGGMMIAIFLHYMGLVSLAVVAVPVGLLLALILYMTYFSKQTQ